MILPLMIASADNGDSASESIRAYGADDTRHVTWEWK